MRPNVDPELELRHALVAERDQARAERDRARDIAVALEQQVAAVRAIHAPAHGGDVRRGLRAVCYSDGEDWPCETRAALDPEPADRGTEERP